jgi:uncharacterized protein (TIGR02448 family)
MLVKTTALFLALFIPAVHAESIDKRPGRNYAGDALGAFSMGTSTTTGLTSSEPFKRQNQYQAAKPDALAFVASGGEIRGAYFEQALQRYRGTPGAPEVSDAQFAEAVAAL